MTLVLGKVRSCRVLNVLYRGAESPGWFDVLTKKLCVSPDAWAVHGRDEAASHQLPVAAAFWIIKIVSTEKCWSLMQNLMQIPCSTYSVILNAMATQYTCSFSRQCLLPPLINTAKSSLFMHMHSSPLSLAARLCWCHANHSRYINNSWTFSGKASYIQKQTNWYHGRWRNKAGFKQQFLKIKVNMSIQYVCGIL